MEYLNQGRALDVGVRGAETRAAPLHGGYGPMDACATLQSTPSTQTTFSGSASAAFTFTIKADLAANGPTPISKLSCNRGQHPVRPDLTGKQRCRSLL